MEHPSTSPYFSNRRVTSASLRRGWMPVTKRFEPGLRAAVSRSSPPRSGGPLQSASVKIQKMLCMRGLTESPYDRLAKHFDHDHLGSCHHACRSHRRV